VVASKSVSSADLIHVANDMLCGVSVV